MEDSDRETKILLQSEAFKEFESGKLPVDLVKEGFCTSEEASSLFREYGNLIGVGMQCKSGDRMIEDLATQIGLLGSRLASIELKLINSIQIPKRRKCPSCKEQSSVGVGVVCRECGEVTPYFEEGMDSLIPSNISIEAYRPWDEEE